LERRAKTLARWQEEQQQQQPADNNNTAGWTPELVKWAVWVITSRVLTVAGEAESGESYRLLIPLLDMCNHDRSSPHILTGRAVPGGRLKVLAGAPVEAGQPINICYGGGVAGNDRFIQDYGFLDTQGFDSVAQRLSGTPIRRSSSPSEGGPLTSHDRERSLTALQQTTLQQDKDLLESAESNQMPNDVRSAIEYRIGIKQALAKYIKIP
jgi:hypothetical protein